LRGSRSTRATNGILAAIAGSASLVLVPWLGKPVFPDEGASLSAAHLSWTALWQHSRSIDLVLLPYYSILHLWIQFFDGIEWARLLSLLAFGLTAFLVGYLGVRLGGRLCGVLAAIVVATNPLLVAAALSARPYALSALAATAAVAALLRWLGGGGGRWAWGFCVASLATLVLQMFAILAPLSVLVAVITVKPEMFRGKWRAMIAPIGLLLAGTLSLAILGAGQRSQIAWIPSAFEGTQLRRAVAGPAAGGYGPYAGSALAAAIVTTTLCLWAWRRAGVRPARLDPRLLAILLAWAALPTAALVAGSLVKPMFVDRYVTASVPGLAIAIALLGASAFDVMTVRLADRPRVVVGSAALGIAAAVLVLAFSVPAARLTYGEAVSRGPPGNHRAAVVAAGGRRYVGMSNEERLNARECPGTAARASAPSGRSSPRVSVHVTAGSRHTGISRTILCGT
jgi:mannosyltransferase